MIRGRDVWDAYTTRGMEERTFGHKKVFTFSEMRNNYYEILQDSAKTSPNKIAFCDNWNRSYTYEQFIEMVDDFAAYLQDDKGVKRGSHVGLLLNNSIEFCTAFYANCKLGAVTVPFPSKYREHEIRSLIDKADLNCLIFNEDYYNWVKDYAHKGIHIIYSKDEENGFGFRHIDLPKGEKGNSAGTLEDEVILMFTSGTTSISKGVVLKNYNLIHATMIYQRILDINSEDKTIIPVPIYHVTGLIALLGLFVYTGGTVYLYRRYDEKRILQCITENKITFMHGSPTVFGMLLDYREEFPELNSIRCLACGSSYMPIEKMKQLHSWMPYMKFQNVYGMTETASPGTIFPYDTPTSIYAASSGKPIPGLDLKIEGEKGENLKENEIGVIKIRGANILEYYYKMESSLIDDEGWLDTGDMGYYNQDGYVFIVDRKKDMVNRGGEKIWCTDVEEAMLKVDGVKDVAVVGIPNEKYGEVAVAVVVLKNGYELSEQDIKKSLKESLARYKIPERILFVNKIPKTPGLKVDKKNIRKLFK